jgi:predicted ATPase
MNVKALVSLLSGLLMSTAFAADPVPSATPAASETTHRYIVERTLQPGALDHLDAAAKAKVNATNEKFGVHWLMSYANAAKTKTYCIDEGPSEAAIRKASAANGLPVDSVTEVPVTLLPK